MTYEVLITVDTKEFIDCLNKKSRRIIKDKLKRLNKNPYPGKHGDKEIVPIGGKMRFRMHIRRTWTVFYSVLENKRQVRVSEIMSIDMAHKKYGY